MVTSVSTDRGRRQRLQSKSHIQAPASISVLPCQIPELVNPAFSLSSAEKRQKEQLSPHLSLQMFGLHEAQDWAKVVLINEPVFLLLRMAGLRTLFNLIKDAQFKHAQGVIDEVLQGHPRCCPLSLFNC